MSGRWPQKSRGDPPVCSRCFVQASHKYCVFTVLGSSCFFRFGFLSFWFGSFLGGCKKFASPSQGCEEMVGEGFRLEISFFWEPFCGKTRSMEFGLGPQATPYATHIHTTQHNKKNKTQHPHAHHFKGNPNRNFPSSHKPRYTKRMP